MTQNNRLIALSASARPYLTDGGLETSLIFHDGVDLPHFAAFTQLDNEAGRKRLDNYFAHYITAAKEAETGFVLDTATWRANKAWGEIMGIDAAGITAINNRAANYAMDLRQVWETDDTPIVVNGAIGPSADGYVVGHTWTAAEAQGLHAVQIDALANAGVDMVTAVTMTYAEEAIGIVNAAKSAGIPVVVSFTVETDGNLPSGQRIGDAIAQVDAETGSAPMNYMINCAHPDHFQHALLAGENWLNQIGAVRANASRMSHAELDEAEELDDGNPGELAQSYQQLQKILPNLKVMGGCCGTDHRHISAIGHACVHSHVKAA